MTSIFPPHSFSEGELEAPRTASDRGLPATKNRSLKDTKLEVRGKTPLIYCRESLRSSRSRPLTGAWIETQMEHVPAKRA